MGNEASTRFMFFIVILWLIAVCSPVLAKVEDVRPAGERAEKPQVETSVGLGFLCKLVSPTPQLTIVPIPQSNPTLGTGLMLAAIYFYAQDESQKRVQPPSSTQAFAMYTSTDSYAFGIQQQSFWDEDRWRFDGILAQGLFNLKFFGVGADAGNRDSSIDWKLRGTFLLPRLLRQVKGDWYLGTQVRYVNTSQSFGGNFDLGEGPLEKITTPELDATSVGVDTLVQRDTRDNRFNAYRGSFLQLDGTVYGEAIGGDFDYQSFDLRYRYYHSLDQSKVLALDGRVCDKGGDVPFYDLCFLQQRGFPVTRYMDESMVSA